MTKASTISLIAAACTILSACSLGSSSSSASADSVTIVLNTASAKLPYVAKFTQQGAQLAAEEINKQGGISVGGKKYQVRLETLDNGLSPTTSISNVSRAVTEKAVAIIDDGYTVNDTYQTAAAAGIP